MANAAEPLTAAAGGETVAAFQRALSREADNLTRWPDLLWQQLHNRLQWEPTASLRLGAERERRASEASRPWLWKRSRFRESRALVRTLRGHVGKVTGCAVAPASGTVVSCGVDGTLRLWDAITGRELAVFDPVAQVQANRASRGYRAKLLAEILCCDVSGDSVLVACGCGDGTIILWDLHSRNAWPLGKHQNPVQSCTFAPSGRFLLSASAAVREWQGIRHGELKCWDLVAGTDAWSCTSAGLAGACAVTPDEELAIAPDDWNLKLWQLATGEETGVLAGHAENVLCCTSSPDGSFLVSGGADRTLKIWKRESREVIATLQGHEGWVRACAVTPDGQSVISAAGDQTLRVWDLWGEGEARVLLGHVDGVNDCAISSDGALLASASADGTVKVWDTARREVDAPGGHTGEVRSCAVDPNGAFVITASADHTLKVWDPDTGQEVATLPSHRDDVNGCAVSPDGKRVISVGDDRALRIWDAATWQELKRLDCIFWGAVVHSCSVSRRFMIAAANTGLIVLDAATCREIKRIQKHTYWIRSVALSPSGAFVALATDRGLTLLKTSSGRLLRTFGEPSGLGGCAVSPDESFAAVGHDESISIWDLSTGDQRVIDFTKTRGKVRACSVSPDGTYLASAGDDRMLRLWEIAGATEIASLPLEGASECVALHPWKPQAVCGDEGGNVHLIEVMGIEYGPLAVLANRRWLRAEIECPVCRATISVKRNQQGKEVSCPTSGCGTHMRVAPSRRQRRRTGSFHRQR